MHFLLVYDRDTASLLSEDAFEERRPAMTARFAAEIEHRDNPSVEVVVLDAETPEALRKTHGRYFMSSRELGGIRR